MERVKLVLDSDEPNVISTKTWSAEDFSRLYVRYKPHVESHVWKILKNASQTEDVVQEAFLYLLTTLPNLDSELGVLRYLKWKARMLALDLLKLKSANELPLDEVDSANLVDSSAFPERSIELAEEAAIVQLALAKIHPRQREVLVATVLEERSKEEVASRMGLSENALRQLNHRARQSFKRSLTSEVEARGLSLNEFLGGSIRKIIEVSKSASVRSGAAVLIAAVSVFSGFQFVQDNRLTIGNSENAMPLSQGQEQSVVESFESPNEKAGGLQIALPENSLTEDSLEIQNLEPAPERVNSSNGKSRDLFEDSPSAPVGQFSQRRNSDRVLPAPDQQARYSANLERFSSVFNQELATMLGGSLTSNWTFRAETNSLHLENSSGLHVELIYNLQAKFPIQFAWISFTVDGVPYIAVPKVSFSELRSSEGGYVLDYVATDLVIGDVVGEMGNVASNESDLSKSALYVQIHFDADQSIYFTELKFESRK